MKEEFLASRDGSCQKDLIDGIVDTMAQVTQQDIRNWFAHYC